MSEQSVLEQSAAVRGNKHLTFTLGEESFGIAVLKIREIIRTQKITPVPHTPPYVQGVINLRGKVIPVVDLRVKFGLNNDDASTFGDFIADQTEFYS